MSEKADPATQNRVVQDDCVPLQDVPSVVVIGAMNLDVIATAGQPAQADDSTPGNIGFYAGGVARNIAEGLTRLSVDTSLHSIVGGDFAGAQLLALCQTAGMCCEHIVTSKNGATPVYVSMNSHDGSLLHAVSDMSLIDRWQMPQLSAPSKAGLCVIDANLPQSVIEDIVTLYQYTPLVAEAVSVSKCRRLQNVLPALELLKVNRHEAAVLVDAGEQVSTEVVGKKLLELGPRKVLMSLGADGAMLFEKRAGVVDVIHTEAALAEVVSVNGAGDALTAGFLAAMLRGKDSATCLQWGVEAAGLSLECFSACSELLSVTRLTRQRR